jgi:hypothetical protein
LLHIQFPFMLMNNAPLSVMITIAFKAGAHSMMHCHMGALGAI